MSCDCNTNTIIIKQNCDCGSEESSTATATTKYLDEKGVLFLLQLLKVAEDKTYGKVSGISFTTIEDAESGVKTPTLVLQYSDGSYKNVTLPTATANSLGLVNLSDSTTDSDSGVDSGVAATPKAVASIQAVLDDPSSLIETDGGLAVDSNGDIYVDFDTMPTNKIEEILSALQLPIWVSKSGNGTRTTGYGDWYVDGDHANASDTIDTTTISGVEYKRGTRPDFPFKTIQACINYVTENYNISKYTVRINIDGGTYDEALTLPDFSRTTGTINLYPYDGDTVKVTHSFTPGGALVNCSGAYWRLYGLDLTCNADGSDAVSGTKYPRCVYSINGATLVCVGCNATLNDNFSGSGVVRGQVMYAGDNGTIRWYGGTIKPQWNSCNSMTICSCDTSGTIVFPSTSDSTVPTTVTLTGKVSSVFSCVRQGLITSTSAQAYDPLIQGTVTAERLVNLEKHAFVMLNSSAIGNLPNVGTDNQVDAASYCYSSVGNN